MDRKDFLKYSGVVLIGLVGLKSIVALISQADKTPVVVVKSEQSRGYGGGKYGA